MTVVSVVPTVPMGATVASRLLVRWRGSSSLDLGHHSWDAVFDLLLRDYAAVARPAAHVHLEPLLQAV